MEADWFESIEMTFDTGQSVEGGQFFGASDFEAGDEQLERLTGNQNVFVAETLLQGAETEIEAGGVAVSAAVAARAARTALSTAPSGRIQWQPSIAAVACNI